MFGVRYTFGRELCGVPQPNSLQKICRGSERRRRERRDVVDRRDHRNRPERARVTGWGKHEICSGTLGSCGDSPKLPKPMELQEGGANRLSPFRSRKVDSVVGVFRIEKKPHGQIEVCTSECAERC